jgi:GNAT superfamily N-acetyltransferase
VTTALRVERVPVAVTLPLRQRVLRPTQTLEELRRLYGDEPDVAAFAAVDASGAVVGTANIRPEPCPWRPTEPHAWRLRGVATEPARQGQGIGAAVLAAVLDHAAERDHASGRRAALVWCNARVPAVPFYLRGGFRVHGAPWQDTLLGPHVRLWRPSDGDDRAGR